MIDLFSKIFKKKILKIIVGPIHLDSALSKESKTSFFFNTIQNYHAVLSAYGPRICTNLKLMSCTSISVIIIFSIGTVIIIII